MNVLYITYNGLMEPISQSQVMPYLRDLSLRYGMKFTILSFERQKDLRGIKGFKQIKENLGECGISWFHLRYHKRMRVLATGLDILSGFVMALYIILKKNIKIIHARSHVPAIIAFLSCGTAHKKYIFDMRGLMADEYVDGGILTKSNPMYSIIKLIEKILLTYASYVIVLTDRIREIIKNKNFLKNKKRFLISVIPCCADCSKFKPDKASSQELKKKIGAVDKRILIYAGSVGTWYLIPEMIDFFKIYKEEVRNAFLILLTQWSQKYAVTLLEGKGLKKEDYYLAGVESSQVPAYINLAEAGLFFCKNCYSKYASSPTKVAEYLACGIPVISNSGIGDVDNLIKTNRVGIVIDELSGHGYREGIDRLLELLREGAGLAARCRSVAESKLSLERGVKAYAGVYEYLSKM